LTVTGAADEAGGRSLFTALAVLGEGLAGEDDGFGGGGGVGIGVGIGVGDGAGGGVAGVYTVEVAGGGKAAGDAGGTVRIGIGVVGGRVVAAGIAAAGFAASTVAATAGIVATVVALAGRRGCGGGCGGVDIERGGFVEGGAAFEENLFVGGGFAEGGGGGSLPRLGGISASATTAATATPAATAFGGSAFAGLSGVRAFGGCGVGRETGLGCAGCGGFGGAVAVASTATAAAAAFAATTAAGFGWEGGVFCRALRAGRAVAGGGSVKLFGVGRLLHEVGDVEEGVALQANLHEGRLHAGKHARDAAVVDGAGEGVFVLALVVDLGEGFSFSTMARRVSCGVLEI
jgi:hypothetical protein